MFVLACTIGYTVVLLLVCFTVADWCVGSVDSDSKKKKKKSRWNTEDDDKTIIPGMPTAIPQNLSKEQEEQYIGRSWHCPFYCLCFLPLLLTAGL